MNATEHTERLAQLIELKFETLTQLHALALRQRELANGEDSERLLRLLVEKQPLLRQLQVIEKGLDPFRQDDPERRVWSSPAARRRCQVLAERTNALLADLLVLEKTAEGCLIAARDATAQELTANSAALAARHAYTAGAVSSIHSPGLDLCSET